MNLIKRIRFKMVYLLKIFVYKLSYGSSLYVGRGVAFRKHFEINIGDNDAELIIGNKVFFNNYCSINCRGKILIGDNCIFGEAVRIYDHNHKFNDMDASISSQGYKIRTVTIGDNCWIGSNVCILAGADIGDNVVIGAGSVIKEHIPSCSIVTSGRSLEIKQR